MQRTWTRRAARAGALAAATLAIGCVPPGDDADAVAFFHPDPLPMGTHAARDSAPDGASVTLRNPGEARFQVDSIEVDRGWFELDLPGEEGDSFAVEPGGWVTIQVRWVGEPAPGRQDYGAVLSADVSPPRGDRAFDQVVRVEGAIELTMICDDDGDGYAATACGGDDCDDGDADHSPATPELCDGLDQNCDGMADAIGGELDEDADGYLSCEDCDDDDGDVHPGAAELCDGLDTDCDPETTAGDGELDYDSDGWFACEECDDFDHDNAPDGVEVCDGADNDCDGSPSPLEVDDDGDSWTECDGDCDDTATAIHPFATDVPGDGVDRDCDGSD